MEQAPRTSFIPKQGFGQVIQNTTRQRRRVNVLGIIAFIIFFGALVLSGGVYFYADYSEKQPEAAKQELAEKRQNFAPGSIESLQALDARISTAKTLLDAHVSPSLLLDVLERTTQQDIQFTSFVFERRPSGNIGVEMEGVAPRFNTVALQQQRFTNEAIFSEVLFHSPNKSETEEVLFEVQLEIAAPSLAYTVEAPPVEIAPAVDFEVEEVEVAPLAPPANLEP